MRAAGEWRREAAALLENTPLVVGQARRRDAHWHPGESRWQGASPLLCPPVRCRPLILLRFPLSSLHSGVLLRDELPQVGRSAIPPDPVSALRVSKCPAYIPQTARAPNVARVTALPFPACKIPGGGAAARGLDVSLRSAAIPPPNGLGSQGRLTLLVRCSASAFRCSASAGLV